MNVISFENVSKKYKLYSKGGLYLRDRMSHVLQRFSPFNATQSSVVIDRQPLERDFWALKNVSFEIKQGESVGFIGRNGAGKSTILKLLASVTKPSSGNVKVNGRLAALIEVGAGFHPELTGRENVFLNGSILGMKKAVIEKFFDSIVSFAELEGFIDTPVKHYSSGMYVRLGFAIAAHTTPNIFLVDEVLAVGDEAFQKKCLATLDAHKLAGKTMILVSHDLSKIEEVCDRCLYVSHGEIRFDGPPGRAISYYRDDILVKNTAEEQVGEMDLSAQAQIQAVSFRDSDGLVKELFRTGEDLIIEIRYRTNRRIESPVFGIAIFGPNGVHLSSFSTRKISERIDAIEGEGTLYCRLVEIPFRDGIYLVTISLRDMDNKLYYDFHNRRYRFEVTCDEKHTEGIFLLKRKWSA